MVDKIQKILDKLSSREKEAIDLVLKKIKKQDFSGLDVKKLKGQESIFRIRKGSLRVIYRLDGSKIVVLAIQRRSENTYKF